MAHESADYVEELRPLDPVLGPSCALFRDDADGKCCTGKAGQMDVRYLEVGSSFCRTRPKVRWDSAGSSRTAPCVNGRRQCPQSLSSRSSSYVMIPAFGITTTQSPVVSSRWILCRIPVMAGTRVTTAPSAIWVVMRLKIIALARRRSAGHVEEGGPPETLGAREIRTFRRRTGRAARAGAR